MIDTSVERPVQAAKSQMPTHLHLVEGLHPFDIAREFTLTEEPHAPPFLRMECTNEVLVAHSVQNAAASRELQRIQGDVQPQQGRTLQAISVRPAYVLINPYLLVPEYQPEIADADLAALGIGPNDSALILAIINFSRGMDQATANLVGPLVVNPATGKAKQVVLTNASDYSARHRLLRE